MLSFSRSVSFFTKALPHGLSLPSGSSSASTWRHSHVRVITSLNLQLVLDTCPEMRNQRTDSRLSPPAEGTRRESCYHWR